jgi:hypothetical protein
MKTISKFFLALSFGAVISFSSCKKDEIEDPIVPTQPTAQTGMFKLELEHTFNNASFNLNTPYTNMAGEEITFTKLNYYVSNVKLKKSDGSEWAEPESYHLVEFEEAITTLISISNVPAATYTGISFMIGVDSTRNVSGAQSGALDAANGMFWSWNNGYIFVKAEGTSPASSNGNFSYHLGGFRESNATNAIQNLDFNFGSSSMDIQPNAAPQIHMQVAVDALFGDSSGQLSVASSNMVHMPGMMAKAIATRFANGIEFDHIHN